MAITLTSQDNSKVKERDGSKAEVVDTRLDASETGGLRRSTRSQHARASMESGTYNTKATVDMAMGSLNSLSKLVEKKVAGKQPFKRASQGPGGLMWMDA